MYLVIGTKNCSQCLQAKKILESKNIDFQYLNFNSLKEDEQEKYMDIARQNNINSFPLVFDDNDQLVDVKTL